MELACKLRVGKVAGSWEEEDLWCDFSLSWVTQSKFDFYNFILSSGCYWLPRLCTFLGALAGSFPYCASNAILLFVARVLHTVTHTQISPHDKAQAPSHGPRAHLDWPLSAWHLCHLSSQAYKLLCLTYICWFSVLPGVQTVYSLPFTGRFPPVLPSQVVLFLCHSWLYAPPLCCHSFVWVPQQSTCLIMILCLLH